jgi:hypothetical protein
VLPALFVYLILAHPYSLTRGRAPAGSNAENYYVCRRWPNCNEEPIPEADFQENRVETCSKHRGVPMDQPAYGYWLP